MILLNDGKHKVAELFAELRAEMSWLDYKKMLDDITKDLQDQGYGYLDID